MSRVDRRVRKASSITVYVDDSPESHKVRKVLSMMDRDFDVIQSSNSIRPVPAIDTGYGLIKGYNNIKRYFADF